MALETGYMAFMVWRLVSFIFYVIISGACCWAQPSCLTSASTPFTEGHESFSPALDPNPRILSAARASHGEEEESNTSTEWWALGMLVACSSGAELAPKSLLKIPCLGKSHTDWGGGGRNGAFSGLWSGDVCCHSGNLAGAGAWTCFSNFSCSAWITKTLFLVIQRLLLKLC